MLNILIASIVRFSLFLISSIKFQIAVSCFGLKVDFNLISCHRCQWYETIEFTNFWCLLSSCAWIGHPLEHYKIHGDYCIRCCSESFKTANSRMKLYTLVSVILMQCCLSNPNISYAASTSQPSITYYWPTTPWIFLFSIIFIAK